MLNKTQSSHYLFLLGALLLALILFSFFLAWIARKTTPSLDQVKDAGSSLQFSDPHHFTTFETGEDEKRLNKKKLDHLNSYGWVDKEKEKQIVHVPIDVAIDLFIKRQKK